MIKLYLQAGLGNQLFQYAYARFLQSKYNEPIIIDTYCCEKGEKNVPHEKCLLSKYKLNSDVFFEKNKWSGIKYYSLFLQKGILRKSLRLLGKREDEIFKICVKHGIYASPNNYFFYPFYFTQKSNKRILGCWQNGHLWEEISNNIRSEIVLKSDISTKTKFWEKRILNDPHSVCVHIRRGDYLNKKFQYLNICDYGYYKTAMEAMQQKDPKTRFYIFSNNYEEIDWIMHNYNFSEFNIFPVYGSEKAEEDLYLISLCRNYIISNSTFSWWGQFLSSFPQRQVYAPSIWNPRLNDAGIYEKDWIRIECNNE